MGDLSAYGSVTRLSGKNREATSVLVAKTYFERPDHVLLAYSRNFPDGLCGGPLAYALGAPLVLTNAGAESAAAEYVTESGIYAGLVLGGSAALSDQTVATIFAEVEIPEEEPETPTEPEPTEPEPTEPTPTEPEPTEPRPTEPKPTEPAPTEPEPTEPKPTEPTPTEPDAEDEELTEEVVYRRLMALQEKYPEGYAWGENNEYFQWRGGGTFENGVGISGGNGSEGFALLVSDEVFGDLPAYIFEENFTIADLRVGDFIRIKTPYPGDSSRELDGVVVLEIYEDHIVAVEGDYKHDGTVHWGSIVTAQQILDAEFFITRYPDGGKPAPEPSEPEEPAPESTEPTETEPEATEPETTEPPATEPEETVPEVTEPEETEPADVLIISDTRQISNQTIDSDVYITSTGVATFVNVTVNGDIYCYGHLMVTDCVANHFYAYCWDSDLALIYCDAWDGTHGYVKGNISDTGTVILAENALDYAFEQWGKR